MALLTHMNKQGQNGPKGYLGHLVQYRLKGHVSALGDDQFHTEVEVISLVAHCNLLHLIGFCITADERILVYPYMPNGTVASKLQEQVNGKPALDWSRRKIIALGTARGLRYLHEQCDPKIIHRDIKASNILLDEYLEAVVADFGLAKLVDHEVHIDQSFFQAKELLKQNQLSTFVDKRLKDEYDSAELEEIVQIAMLCTMYYPCHRPMMSEVVRMLEDGDGVAEKWEALKDVEQPKSPPLELLLFAICCDSDQYSSAELLASELSGPR
ncbi:hypothetical protein PR202_gb24724 [Eleusine coracana subsp. coracana]|uniref:non-specific serine/threonine protein kinase n=1 Tax=Eleusine coracana subsp. coracana TaxID=191504 RepID=A0AAV5FJS3_ELECO|nr:hypothetical protein PR202_gb24724 [Eleusine coracana subsp. coracana]